MNPRSTEDAFVEVYSEVFYQLLISIFTARGKVAKEFYLLSVARQRELEEETRKRTLRLAQGFVERIKQKGFLENEPTRRELRKLFRSYLEEASNEP